MHEPVLLKEVVDSLHIKKAHKYIDATLGAGGYSIEIVKNGGMVLGIDTDPKMLEIARDNLNKACPIHEDSRELAFKLVHGNFRNIDTIAKTNGFENVAGIVFDLGVSSFHFLDDDRGFSFRDEGSLLDMRFDPTIDGVTAADLLNKLREDQLREILGYSIARKVVESRRVKTFENVSDLLNVTGRTKFGKIHPATKTFMALRIAVNSELDNLVEALPKAYSLLESGGVMAVVSFHSGEDRIVKNFLDGGEMIIPTREEVLRNPKARSAKLRVFRKK